MTWWAQPAMFNDLFHLVAALEHDYREENGKQVHWIGCRRCAIAMRLMDFKAQIHHVLSEIEFALGEPVHKEKIISSSGMPSQANSSGKD
jgi:hypothetical protein